MNEKRVCVISAYTYIQQHINYGSLFQYYALETILKNLGYAPYWLRYIIKEPKLSGISCVKQAIKKILKLDISPQERKILRTFDDFVSSKLTVSKNIYYSEDELKMDPPAADYYITGSDQVWGGVDSANYLCFVPKGKKKISYAASFGKSEISDAQMRTIKPWLKNFDFISVREESGLNICEKINVKAERMIDPTFLLNRSDFPCSDKYIELDNQYLLLYFLNINNSTSLPLEEINEMSETTKIKTVAGVSEFDQLIECKYLEYFAPEDWLSGYKYAEGILTNTFHGTVFALIYHKPFLVFLQKGRFEKQNERIFSLLRLYGLEDRVYDGNQKILIQLKEKIDWVKVDNIISQERNKAQRFIMKTLA
ncbi:polysaccharide pyruvyl transferase family protein [[Clostridium] fimetarium]|nr:polysaccharide pyruvyl transferase family protein [[Clostridium] fimetarium]